MKQDFVQFQSFNDIGLAKEMSDWLSQHQIASVVEDNSPSLDPVIIGNGLDASITLKLRSDDFPRAHEALEHFYQAQIQDIDKDYYLFSFSNDELKAILEQPFEWSYIDFLLAQQLLKQRGIEVTAEELSLHKQKSIIIAATPEKLKMTWIVLGYLFAFLLSLVGIFYGASILVFRKTLPNGQRINVYDRDTRIQGVIILVISFIMALIRLAFNVVQFSLYPIL